MSRYAAARLTRCNRCGLVFAGDIPPLAELSAHYARYPANSKVEGLTVRRYGELLDLLEPFRQTSRLLDVGCGDGWFLLSARDRGWEVFGSEYGAGPRERAKSLGLDVRPAPFPAAAGENGTFDVITAIEVLEHVVSPREEAERICSLLRRGGVFYLTTPNFNSLSRRLLGARWRVIEYPEHLTLFTPRTLDDLLAKGGFRKLSIETTGLSPSDLLAHLARRHNEHAPSSGAQSVDARLRTRVERSRKFDAAVRATNAVLSRLRSGDTIKASYERL